MKNINLNPLQILHVHTIWPLPECEMFEKRIKELEIFW